MSDFCKLYQTELGQILVKMDSDDDCKAEVRFYFQPKDLGVCSFAMTMKGDSEEDWENAQTAFDQVTEESAVKMVSHLLQKFTQA